MKFKRLLKRFGVYALALAWPSFVNAQTDVTSTYIQNADFETTPIVFTSSNGTTAQTDRITGIDVSGKNKGDGNVYTIPGWSYAGECKNNAVQIATAEYGMTTNVNNGLNNTTPPSADNNGNKGVALGISAGWGDDAIITQTATLPAGVYTLTYNVYNQNTGNNGIAENFTGVKLADGTSKLGTLKTATYGKWTSETIYFTIPTEQQVTFSIGFTTSSGSSGAGAKLYVDNLKLVKFELEKDTKFTSWIANAGFEEGTETSDGNKFNKPYGWSIEISAEGWRDGSINTTAPSEGTKQYNLWAGKITSLDLYQQVANLPIGKYTLSADLRTDAPGNINDQCVYATIGSTTTKSGTITNVASTWNSADGWNTLSTDFYVGQENSQVRIGASSTGDGSSSKGWFQIDNFQLVYLGKKLSDDASATSSSSFTAEADKWYAIPITIAGNYQLTPSAGTVYYTQNGELMPYDEEATATSATSATEIELQAGYLYVKASEATSIALVAATKSYEVGTASADVEYIQKGQIVTIKFNDATTNDESASFVKLGNVSFNGTEVDMTANGTSFSFTIPENIDANKSYVLSIPAGAFGYDGHATCDAQELTLKTPAVFDGAYFIKATDATYAGKYISRGADSNTEAALDPYGLAINVATDSKNVSTLYLVDNNKPLVLNKDNIAYTDGKLDNENHKRTYTITATDGGYTLYNIDKAKYLAAGERNNNVVATASDNAYAWTLETPSDHTASMTTLKNEQAKAAATKAGLAATTSEELESEANADLVATNVAISLSGNEFYSDASNTGNAVGTRSSKVTITNAGLYKFTLPAYTRAAGAYDAYAMHNDETEALVAYAFFDDNQTQVRSLYSEEGKTANTNGYLKPDNAEMWWPNNTATGTAEFNSDKYANDIWMYLDAGEYTFGITNSSKALCSSWTWFGAPTLTYYASASNLYPIFAELHEACKPWTPEGEYVEEYNSYADYSESTSAADLMAAIEYMNANYDTYAWDNASMEHPYDTKAIVNPTYDNGETGWSKTQNSTGGYSDGIDANGNNYYYKASSQVRHATIYQEGIKLKAGTYCLSANMTGDIKDATSTYIYATDGTVNHWSAGIFEGNVWKGYLTSSNAWTNVKCYFTLSQETTLRIGALSWGNNRSGDTKGNFAVDDWKLEYVKYVVDTNDNAVTVYGPAPVDEINAKITSDINTIDLIQATNLSNVTIATDANPNAIIYATQGAVSNAANVVVDGTCANFVLTDGHPFVAAKSFSATNASYTMTAIADGKFGTLMLPFAAQLPADGKAYALDEDIDVVGGKVNGSEVSALTANTPVLVTKAGSYTGSNVDIAATEATTYTNGNLTGVYAQTEAPQGSYVLQNHPQSQGVAFYLVGDVKPTVKPFRAYIPAQSSNAKAIRVVFDGEATAIDGITTSADDNAQVYDLSGRKVAKAHKGVYIKNGKKVVVK